MSKQRAFLQSKKQYLAENIVQSKELVIDIKQARLLKENTLTCIMNEKCKENQVSQLLDAVFSSERQDACERFIAVLAKRQRPLVEDLLWDYVSEKGISADLEEIVREASSPVHRTFGNSKRLGQADKRVIVELLSIQIYLKNIEWYERTLSTKDQLDAAKQELREHDAFAHEVSRTINRFVREHSKRLETHAHSMTTTTDALSTLIGTKRRSGSSDLDARALTSPLSVVSGSGAVVSPGNLHKIIEHLLMRIELVLSHRDSLLKERQRIMQLLKVRKESIDLPKVIRDLLGTYQKRISSLNEENFNLKNMRSDDDDSPSCITLGSPQDEDDILDLIVAKDAKIASLSERLALLQKESVRSERQIVGLREELDETRTRMIALAKKNRQLENSIKLQRQRDLKLRSFSDSCAQDLAAAAAGTDVTIVDLNDMPSPTPRKLSSASAKLTRIHSRLKRCNTIF